MQQLNKQQQRWLAVGLLCSVIFILGALIFMPWYNAVNNIRDDIEDLTFRIKRYERVIASRDEVLREVEKGRKEINALGYFYTQETTSLAAAELQKRIKDIVQRAGGEITSTQVLPHKEEEDLLRVAVKVKLSGDMEMLRSLLYDIDIEKPLISIDNLSITPKAKRRMRGARKAVESGEVIVSLDVSGYMRKAM